MTEDHAASTPLRQFRVTLTENRDHTIAAVHLSWRSFPCRADQWDGYRWYATDRVSSSPVSSVDALRALLLAIGEGEWYEARYPRHDGA